MADMVPAIPGMKDEDTDERIVGSSPKAFKRRIDRSKRERKDYIYDWQTSVDRRRAKPTTTDSDDNRQRVPIDWSHTKTKVAALFSQVPRVIVTAEAKEYKPAAPVFGKHLNMRLRKGGIEATMFEVVPDVINKAGLGAAMVRYECTKDIRQVPAIADADLPTMEAIAISLGLAEREMVDQPYIVDRRFVTERIDPDNLLWDADEFEGSDFDQSSWIGHSGRCTWAQAKGEFKLSDEQREKALGDTQDGRETKHETEGTVGASEEDVVCYDEIFYWRYLYHDDEKYFKAIQRMVFIEGLGDEPVVNEPWDGQRFDEALGTYLGSCRFPIQVLTFNYMSSEPIPPSDSAIMRPQVDELEKSRFQMFLHRDHSRPIRWADVNRMDADILTNIMQGDWGHFIPTQGPGDKAIGEVARSNYPRDDYEFDRVIKNDMMEATGVGQNQLGVMATGERSAAEAKITQGNYSTRTAQERARTVSFFLRLADVMAGLMCLHDDFQLPDREDIEQLEMWDRTRINHELAFSTRGDASVLLDAEQRFNRLERFLNIAGKSGMYDPMNTLKEMAELTDIDPDDVHPPAEKKVEAANISYRFSGEDMVNPLALAVMAQSNQLPGPDAVFAAKKAIMLAAAPVPPEETPPVVPELPPQGPGGAPPKPGAPPQMEDNRPDWQLVDRINSRRDASQNK
jgi:hypothetical protein